MLNKIEAIVKKDFALLGILDDERDMLGSFDEHSGYICDAITELADSYIPIYNFDVWDKVSDIQEYIEEAIAEGLVSTEGEVDLIKIFQSGYYQYYSRSLYNNLDVLAFNYIADKVNESINSLDEGTQTSIDFDEIESAIESETDNYDNNNQFDDLEDTAQDIIERIKEGEFAL